MCFCSFALRLFGIRIVESNFIHVCSCDSKLRTKKMYFSTETKFTPSNKITHLTQDSNQYRDHLILNPPTFPLGNGIFSKVATQFFIERLAPRRDSPAAF